MRIPDQNSSGLYETMTEKELKYLLKQKVEDLNYLIQWIQQCNLNISLGVDKHGKLFAQQPRRIT